MPVSVAVYITYQAFELMLDTWVVLQFYQPNPYFWCLSCSSSSPDPNHQSTSLCKQYWTARYLLTYNLWFAMQKKRNDKVFAVAFPIRSSLYFLTILLVCRSLYIIVAYYHNTTIQSVMQCNANAAVKEEEGRELGSDFPIIKLSWNCLNFWI